MKIFAKKKETFPSNTTVKEKGRIKQFFAKLSRGLMLPIAILPMAGLLLGIGGALGANLKGNEVAEVFSLIFKAMSDIVFANLPILFCIAITITFSKDKGTSGFCSALAYLVFCSSQLPFFQYEAGKLTSIFWFHDPITELMGKTLGMDTLQTSIFGGIIVGAITSFIYNRISKIKLPQAIEFFSGVRLVPFVLIPVIFLVALLFCLFWPWVGQGILYAGRGIQDVPYGAGGFIYGTLGRALMPFGLHHIPITLALQTPIGGTLSIDELKAAFDKVSLDPQIQAEILNTFNSFVKADPIINGDQNIWNFINAIPYNKLPDITGKEIPLYTWFNKYAGVYAGRFTQDYPTYLGVCMGIGAAIIATAEKANRKRVASVVGSAMVVAFLTGITEPLEFTFLFCAPWLYYLFYVPLSGFSYMFMELLNAHVGVGFARGFIDLMIYGALPILKGTNFYWAFPLAVGEGLLVFIIFYLCIKKFNIATPGRKDNPMILINKKTYNEMKSGSSSPNANSPQNERIIKIINLLGGLENIEDVSACATRLRVSVKTSKGIDGDAFNELGSRGHIIKGSGLQLIFGGEASIIADEINEIIDQGIDISQTPAPTQETPPPPAIKETKRAATNKKWLSHPLNEPIHVYAPCDGIVVDLKNVPDELFSSNALGQGIAINPTSYELYPVIDNGQLKSVFPTKHAYLFSKNNVDILMHLGIDSAANGNKTFDSSATENQDINFDQQLLSIKKKQFEKAKSTISPIVVPELKNRKITYVKKDGEMVKRKELLFIIE